MEDVFWGLMIPLFGTMLGAACVFFMQGRLNRSVQRGLTGFAAGVMVAASFFSLLIPALEQLAPMGQWAFLPAVIGFGVGVAFLLFLDHIIPHLHMNAETAEGPRSHLKKTTMLILAGTLHNIPEGMAVGIVYAGLLSGQKGITEGAALALAVGIAIQNFPEGAIISMPLRSEGVPKGRAFFLGAASVFILPVLPYLLSFAAGAMLYVVVEDLIPEMSVRGHSNLGVIFFSIGFTVMMALDVALS